MGQDLVTRSAVPARQEKPWRAAGQRGPDVQLFFDPDDHSLWVFAPEDGRYRRVNNLAVTSLRLEYQTVPEYGFGDYVQHIIRIRTKIDLSADLIDQTGGGR